MLVSWISLGISVVEAGAGMGTCLEARGSLPRAGSGSLGRRGARGEVLVLGPPRCRGERGRGTPTPTPGGRGEVGGSGGGRLESNEPGKE